MEKDRELVVLFGNGPNFFGSNPIMWKELLEQLCEEFNITTCSIFDNKPYPMIYEEILIKSNVEEELLKSKIIDKLRKAKSNVIYNRLRDLKLNNYITKNYDLSLETSFSEEKYSINYNTSLGKGAETIYSIRTKNTIIESPSKNVSNIWHIHGDINRTKSICLGLDHYCGALGKMKSYIQNSNYETCKNSMEDKINNPDLFDDLSWIELFFNAEIHILGLQLDFIETDLWWLLNKRTRLCKNPSNKIIFHTEQDEDIDKKKKEEIKAKKELLEVFNVEYKTYPFNSREPNDWALFYDKVFNNLEKNNVRSQ